MQHARGGELPDGFLPAGIVVERTEQPRILLAEGGFSHREGVLLVATGLGLLARRAVATDQVLHQRQLRAGVESLAIALDFHRAPQRRDGLGAAVEAAQRRAHPLQRPDQPLVGGIACQIEQRQRLAIAVERLAIAPHAVVGGAQVGERIGQLGGVLAELVAGEFHHAGRGRKRQGVFTRVEAAPEFLVGGNAFIGRRRIGGMCRKGQQQRSGKTADHAA